MLTTDIQNVRSIKIQEVMESVDVAWRSIIIDTDQGRIEIVLTASDVDNLQIAI